MWNWCGRANSIFYFFSHVCTWLYVCMPCWTFFQHFLVIFIQFFCRRQVGTRLTRSIFLYFGQRWPWSVHQGVVQARVCVTPRHRSTHTISTVHAWTVKKKNWTWLDFGAGGPGNLYFFWSRLSGGVMLRLGHVGLVLWVMCNAAATTDWG